MDTLVHAGAALAVVLLLAFLGRHTARLLRQPEVIGEITLGLAAAPVLIAIGGHGLLDSALPTGVVADLRQVGHIGLVLFLAGVGHELRRGARAGRGRAVAVIAAGATLIPLLAGSVVAFWVLAHGGPALRGTAPAPALALLLAVSLTVTALPVLARILAERGLTDTSAGRLALGAALVVDVVTWVLLALALGMAAGGSGRFPRLLAVAAGGVAGLFLLRFLVGLRPVAVLRDRWPWACAVLVAWAALGCSYALQRAGLTEFFGAMLLGLALPAEGWERIVALVSAAGRALAPVFFVVTGLTVFARQVEEVPWFAVLLVTGLGIGGKVLGGYAGARLAKEPPLESLRIGVLLNTRGLTELVVLQAGFNAGLLTPAMFLGYVVMALVTTAATGPACAAIDRASSRAPLVTPLPEAG